MLSAIYPQPMRITTLGRVLITRDGQPLTGFISRKVEALFIYLACEPREHAREVLGSLLWDGMSQERTMGNLRTALSNLQGLLGDYLSVTRQTVQINPEAPIWIDAHALLETLDAAAGSPQPEAWDAINRALELYAGDFLAGLTVREANGFHEWARQEGDRIRGTALAALPGLVREALDKGRLSDGLAVAQRWIAIDPLAEAGHRALMQMLVRNDQRAAALRQFEQCRRLLRDELGVEPDAETVALYERIRSQLELPMAADTNAPVSPISASGLKVASAPGARRAPIVLPTPATPFIDRPAEARQVAERLLDPACRLLTIVGSGGSGKTRLAIHCAGALADHFPDGVYFVPLAGAPSGDFLPVEIANVLHITLQGGEDSLSQIARFLDGQRALLVLDNFEHLMPSAGFVSDLLSRTSGLRVLVTSREWLNLQEEWLLPIDGLAYPQNASPDAVRYGAVQLFAACARRMQPRFSLDAEKDAVIAICQRVEGMPLSIELAATWLRVIPAAEIARQIDLRFLASTSRNLPERHRSIHAVFDYSWRLLSAAEQQALMKIAVFRGPFSREAAAAVAGASLPILASLVEKSLVRRLDAAHKSSAPQGESSGEPYVEVTGETYYDVHELLRQFAYEHLVASGEERAVSDAHLKYFVRLTDDPDSRLHGQTQTRWLDRLEREHENLRAALGWALECATPDSLEAGLKIGASIWEFWLMRGHIGEGRAWLDRLLSTTEGEVSLARGAVTQGAGYLTWIQGDSDRAEALHREGLAIRQALGDKAGMGGSLSNLGVIAWSRGDFAAARSFYEQAYAVRKEANYRIGMASVLTNLSLLLQDQGDFASAMAHAEEALALFTELDDLQGKALILFNMGAMTYDRGDWVTARAIQEQALRLNRELGDRRAVGALLQNLALTVLSLGDRARSRQYLDESEALVRESGDKTQWALVQKTKARQALAGRNTEAAQVWIQDALATFQSVNADVYRGQALVVLGDIQRMDGHLSAAAATYRTAFETLFMKQNRAPAVEALYCLAGLTWQLGEPERAARLLGAADALAAQMAITCPHATIAADRAAIEAGIAPPVRQALYADGAALDPDALIAFVRGA